MNRRRYSTFRAHWTRWAKTASKTVDSSPGEGVDELAAWLYRLHRTLREHSVSKNYIGPMVNGAIRDWKTPKRQERVSSLAIWRWQRAGHERKGLGFSKEHDPPVAYYRELVCRKKPVSLARFSRDLRGMLVTWVTKDESDRLNKKDKSVRLPSAYQKHEIKRREVPKGW